MKTIVSSRGAALGSAALLLLVAGCGPSKVAQCNDFIEVSNDLGTQGETFGQELEAELNEQLSGSSDFGAIANDLNTAADTIDTKAGEFVQSSTSQLGDVELQDETLQGYQSSYIELINTMGTRIDDMTTAVRGMADVFEGINPEALTSQAQVQQLEAQLIQAEAAVNEAVAELDKTEAEEDALISEINSYCGATEG